MDITPMVAQGTNLISGYNDKAIKVNNTHIDYDFIIAKDILIRWQTDFGLSDVKTYQIFLNLIKDNKTIGKIILIGTGLKYIAAAKDVINLFAGYNLTVDFMATLDACRTYNILVTEQRPVFALIRNIDK